MRPPSPEEYDVYTCQDLDRFSVDRLEEEAMFCQQQVEGCRRVSWKSWWAFRLDECLKRISRF